MRRQRTAGLCVGGLALMCGVVAILLTGCDQLFSQRPVATSDITTAGGTLTVIRSNSPLSGMTIDFPTGALDHTATVEIRESSDTVKPASGFSTPLGPCFEIRSTAAYLSRGVVLTVPIDCAALPSGQALVLAGTSEDGSWDVVFCDSVDCARGVAVFTLHHLSRWRVFAGQRNGLQSSTPDIDFDPLVDAMPCRDQGSGDGAGIAAFASWYWDEKSASDGGLRAKFVGSVAVDIANEAQAIVRGASGDYGDSEDDDVYEIVEALRQNGQPVLVSLAPHDEAQCSTDSCEHHAVVAYKWEAPAQALLCYDPNSDDLRGQIRRLPGSASDWGFYREEQEEPAHEGVSSRPNYTRYAASLLELYNRYANLQVDVSVESIGLKGAALKSTEFAAGDTVAIVLAIKTSGCPVPLEARIEAEIASTMDHGDTQSVTEGIPAWQTNVDLPPNGERLVQLEYTIPADAEAGRYDLWVALVSRTDDAAALTRIYDTTEPGANNDLASSAWVTGFRIVDSDPEAFVGTWYGTFSLTGTTRVVDRAGTLERHWTGTGELRLQVDYAGTAFVLGALQCTKVTVDCVGCQGASDWILKPSAEKGSIYGGFADGILSVSQVAVPVGEEGTSRWTNVLLQREGAHLLGTGAYKGTERREVPGGYLYGECELTLTEIDLERQP